LKPSLPTASRLGRRQRGGFLFFFEKKPVPRAPGKGRQQRCFLFFRKKTLCRAPLAKAVSKDSFLFFKKKFFAERPVQLRSAKLGTPELGRFSQSCRA
jgi:hypothetical protein